MKGRDPLGELDMALDALEKALKSNEVGAELTARGVNTSLALTTASGLRAYLHGDKGGALEDLGTVVEEIAARMASQGVAS